MKQIMGVINLVNEPDDLEELTYNRTIASVPFGGRYRLIDFALSNMVNSGLEDVAVFVHKKYRSLMDHLGSGQEWDLDRKRGGLFVLPPSIDEMRELMKGDLYNFYSHRDYFYRSNKPYVLISRSHIVCNIDYCEVLESHVSSGADITMVYKEISDEENSKFRRIETDENGRVTVMEEHTGRSRSNKVSMEMYLMSTSLLLDMIDTCLAQGYDYFVRDGIMKNLGKLKVHGHPFKGHLGIINTIQSYYANSMKLLDPRISKNLFFENGLIYTKVKDEPPAKYLDNANVTNSMIANGCIIEGHVENSILFRGVKVRKGAYVKNSIVLQNCVIDIGAHIEKAILDKDVFIQNGNVLQGDARAPFIAAKKKVI
ncbi:glucose-1-phosphate adenylyltransferase [Paenibacillus swuensis]|uniref:Glucose-1-phosphate adenylyltransferase n=1 Tax=Paenibacillus swuensis TaxID=1178515 RepID=A0A172TF57_9BACL|nr:glucose-1-phosphate adenylyltransferase subunit GlgD [Paenibacillus swuensis]ANE45576.1 glucose-1-phosphate adenylyltransferase [Paenibacillus swuensis]